MRGRVSHVGWGRVAGAVCTTSTTWLCVCVCVSVQTQEVGRH